MRAVERRAVIEAGAGVLDERLDVLRGLVRKELEADHAEVGGDHGFEARGLFGRDRRRFGAGLRRVLLARGLSEADHACQQEQREEDKETRRQGDKETGRKISCPLVPLSPCPLVLVSPSLRHNSFSAISMARIKARDLLTVSMNSASGAESATLPPPACT